MSPYQGVQKWVLFLNIKKLVAPKAVTRITFDKKNFFLKKCSKPGDLLWGQNFAPPIEISIFENFQNYRRKFVNSSFDWKFYTEKH